MTPTEPGTPADSGIPTGPGTSGEPAGAAGPPPPRTHTGRPAWSEPSAPADPDSDTELRARLAATPLREPAPERVRGWQAALRELPPPTRSGHWGSGPEWPEWPETRLAVADPATRHDHPTKVIEWPPEGPDDFEEGFDEFIEGLGSAANSLRVATEGPVIDGHTTSAPDPEARSDDASGSVDDPNPPSECPPPKGLRSITLEPVPTPLSCDRPDGAPRPANIRFAAARRPAAMATGPLTMADAGVAVAKIRRGQPRSGVAAAIGGLAAAIIAVAVLTPSVATRGHSTAAREPSAAGSAEGPAATAAGLSKDPSTGWPGAFSTRPSDHPGPLSPRLPDHPGSTSTGPLDHRGRPADDPGSPLSPRLSDPPGALPPRPSDRSADSEPLTLTRAQLLAAPPSGRDLGPLADPGALPRCLARFGSTAQPVAARRVVLDGQAGVLLVLPTDLPGRLRLLVVDPHCTTALADDTVGR